MRMIFMLDEKKESQNRWLNHEENPEDSRVDQVESKNHP
jgi:hypothetical protein